MVQGRKPNVDAANDIGPDLNPVHNR
jgi:hypothetical protein